MTIWDFKVQTHPNQQSEIFRDSFFISSPRSNSCVFLCLPPQSLEASIQGLRIMWRNLVNEWRDAAASLLPLAPTPESSLPPPSPPPPLCSCDAASNTHNWPPYRVSAEALTRPRHTLVGVCKHSHTHTHKSTQTRIHYIHTHWADVWHHCWFFCLFVFKWRLTRCQSGKVLWHVLKRDVKCVFLCSLTSCTKSWTLKCAFYPKVRLYFTTD